MINRTVLVGRLTKDPELRRTAQGDAVASFTLAVNRNFAKEGQQQADFINCVVWRKSAENVERYCSKGSLVGVDGRIQTRSYDNAQGQKVYVVEVICDSVQFFRNQNQAQIDTQKVQQMNNDNYFHNGASTNTNNINNINSSDFMEDVNTYDILEEDLQF